MSETLGMTHPQILTRKSFTHKELDALEKCISRREQGEPLQYILNSAEFYNRNFTTGHGSLIPRHDTESLITATKAYISPLQNFCLLDWGTGTGCIGITLLMEFKNSFAYMYDISTEALTYARKNVEHYEVSERARIITDIDIGEIDAELELVVSNPPYVASSEIASLMKTVRDYEPVIALAISNGGKTA